MASTKEGSHPMKLLSFNYGHKKRRRSKLQERPPPNLLTNLTLINFFCAFEPQYQHMNL